MLCITMSLISIVLRLRAKPTSLISTRFRRQTIMSASIPTEILEQWRKRHISSEVNEKVKLLSSIQQRKKKNMKDFIVLEGHRTVLDAILAGLLPEHIMLNERALDAPLGMKLFDALRPHSTCVCTATDAVINKITDTISNQGVVAMFKLIEMPLPQVCSLVVICDGISDPGNLGTIIRTAYGFGVDAVVAVGGVDPWASAVGGAKRVYIPMAKTRPLESLNAASAAAILLAETCRQRSSRAPRES